MSKEIANEDFARPGAADFTGFPKDSPEDTISYSIYLVPSKLLSVLEIRSRLNSVLQASKVLSKALFQDHIWQRDPYGLDFDESGLSHLCGSTCFADSIADEWAIVYVLRELSKQFGDAWVRVTDADGQFLLVEAAGVLPEWLEPDAAEYRVWINDGHLRIVPQFLTAHSQAATARPDDVDLETALSFIKDKQDDMMKSEQIESEAFHRLRKYPAQVAESMHTARIVVPRKLAYVLKRIPATISPTVEAFCMRDRDALKLLDTSSSELIFPPVDMVKTSVKFTRVGYAQLKGQNIDPPILWAHFMNLSPSSNDTERSMTGMKVTLGFELLLMNQRSENSKAVREIRLLLDDLKSGDSVLPTDEEIAASSTIDDDESWLDVDFEAFERELAGQANPLNEAGGAFSDPNAQDDLRRIVQQFQDMLNDPDAGPDHDDDDDEDYSDSAKDAKNDPDYHHHKDSDTDASGEDKANSFSNAEFEAAMKQMMGLPPTDSNRRNQITDREIEELESAGSEAEDDGDGKSNDSDDTNDSDDSDDRVDHTDVEHTVSPTVSKTSDTKDDAMTTLNTVPPQASNTQNSREDEITTLTKMMISMEAELREAGLSDTVEDMPTTDAARRELAKAMLESMRSDSGEDEPIDVANLMASLRGGRMQGHDD